MRYIWLYIPTSVFQVGNFTCDPDRPAAPLTTAGSINAIIPGRIAIPPDFNLTYECTLVLYHSPYILSTYTYSPIFSPIQELQQAKGGELAHKNTQCFQPLPNASHFLQQLYETLDHTSNQRVSLDLSVLKSDPCPSDQTYRFNGSWNYFKHLKTMLQSLIWML